MRWSGSSLSTGFRMQYCFCSQHRPFEPMYLSCALSICWLPARRMQWLRLVRCVVILNGHLLSVMVSCIRSNFLPRESQAPSGLVCCWSRAAPSTWYEVIFWPSVGHLSDRATLQSCLILRLRESISIRRGIGSSQSRSYGLTSFPCQAGRSDPDRPGGEPDWLEASRWGSLLESPT